MQDHYCSVGYLFCDFMCYWSLLFSSPGQRPAELMGWCSVRHPSHFSFQRLLQNR